jgi:hypothetical protein
MSQCHDSYDPVEQPVVHVAPDNGGLADGAQCHDTYPDLPAPAESATGPEKPVGTSVE